MARRRRIAALAALTALSFAACTNTDADRGDVEDAMTDAGLSTRQAECVADRFDETFNQEQLNDLAAADEPEDFPEGTSEEVDQILRRCTEGDGEGGGSTDTTEGGAGEGGTESTETTEGESTSTTAAGG